jgi:AcrR family transcriptional regulator
LRVFAERGYDGASMDDVAREAGITKAAIYHHVSGKEELLARGLNGALDALFAILAEPGADRGDPDARLRYIVRRVAETTFTLLPELSVLFRVRPTCEAARKALERRRVFDRRIADLIRQAQRDGALSSEVEPGLASRLIFGMSNSVVEWYRPGGALGPSEIAAAVERLAFEGLRQR